MTPNMADARVAAGGRSFYLFVYGTLRQGGAAAHLLAGCERVGHATVAGTLYDIDRAYPALVLAGGGEVAGEVWRCPVERLAELDRYEGVEARLFRRVGVQVGEYACWTYVAGAKLARQLVPERRVRSAEHAG